MPWLPFDADDFSCFFIVSYFCGFNSLDALGILHAGFVLYGTRNAQSDVHLGMHCLDSLANLLVSKQLAAIDSSTKASIDSAQVHAQLVGQVAALGDHPKIGGHQFDLAPLAEHPYILESRDISTAHSAL